MDKVKVNLGCGHHYLRSWSNLDFKGNSAHVISHNLCTRLPFANKTCDVVYHSHVLEHLTPSDGQNLLMECYRILKEEGVLRVVVPDLEQKARAYLRALENAVSEDSVAAYEKHSWMIVELLDQMVRTQSGGKMADFIRSGKVASFVSERLGSNEYNLIRSSLLRDQSAHSHPKKIKDVRSCWRTFLDRWAYNYLQINEEQLRSAKFKQLGENHLWMYDSVSLMRLMDKVGFRELTVQTASSSYIKDWHEDGVLLDVIEEEPHHPDSLYIEGLR